MLKKLWNFFRRETVLSLAFILAVLSCFLVPPDGQYPGYLDKDTLLTLFCLMTVMAGFQEMGLFRRVGQTLLRRIRSQRQLALMLVFLCFFSSMLITNDVSLLTFVPLGLLLSDLTGMDALLCRTVTLMTIAANLGSMLTPIGNPQNLYLYSVSGISLGAFLAVTLPYTVLSGVLLALSVFLCYRGTPVAAGDTGGETEPLDRRRLLGWLVLFAVCLLEVLGVVPAEVMLAVILAAVLVVNRKLLLRVDYSLLATFVCLFVFIGNMKRFPAFHSLVAQVLEGHVRLASVGISQIISNVPAALLLSGFTDAWEDLLVGTNIGGLGTLIASMASLISYKQMARRSGDIRGKYLGVFTLWNVIFLAILLVPALL